MGIRQNRGDQTVGGSKENREDVLLEQEAAQEKEPCDIVAHRDGRVISIVTRSGVPRVSAGQTFKKGDILVSGTLEIKNDAQEVTGYEYVTADADIWAFLSYSYYDEFSRQYTQRIYTGEDSRGSFLTRFLTGLILDFARMAMFVMIRSQIPGRFV